MQQNALALARSICRHCGHTHGEGTAGELLCLSERYLFTAAALAQAQAEARERRHAPGLN